MYIIYIRCLPLATTVVGRWNTNAVSTADARADSLSASIVSMDGSCGRHHGSSDCGNRGCREIKLNCFDWISLVYYNGFPIFDQYTYLHFAVGIIAYFWNISLLLYWFVLHSIFEFVENTQMGINIINKYIVFWPGGKPNSDSVINILGDTTGAILGWLSAYYFDKLGVKYNWYESHIK